jgi:hypothetical protein
MDIEKSSSLYDQFLKLKPLYASKTEALAAFRQELEMLASKHGKSIEDLLYEAHTTATSKNYHTQALSIERGIAFLRR